jgi:hypothetical protein
MKGDRGRNLWATASSRLQGARARAFSTSALGLGLLCELRLTRSHRTRISRIVDGFDELPERLAHATSNSPDVVVITGCDAESSALKISGARSSLLRETRARDTRRTPPTLIHSELDEWTEI